MIKQRNDGRNISVKKIDMIVSMEKTLGVVTPALKNANINRSSHYKWYKEDLEYKAAIDVTKDIALDFAESKLHQNIQGNKETSIIFFLKTQGKRRGYVERTEHGIDGEVKIDLNTLTVNIKNS